MSMGTQPSENADMVKLLHDLLAAVQAMNAKLDILLGTKKIK